MTKVILSDKRYINTEKVAYNIINNQKDLYLIDVRSVQEYNDFHLPGANNIPLNDILNPSSLKNLVQKDKSTVLYSNSSVNADMAWFLITRYGFDNIYVLNGGLNKFYNDIFLEKKTHEGNSVEAVSEARFIKEARTFFKEGRANNESSVEKSIPKPTDAPLKAVKGGC